MKKQAKTLDEFIELHNDQVEFEYRGYKCFIMVMSGGYLNGYVLITKNHPAYMKRYYELDIDCHGGLSFSDFASHKNLDDGWFIGFDCAHAGDLVPNFSNSPGVWRDEEYVTNELKSIVEQLIEMEIVNEQRK